MSITLYNRFDVLDGIIETKKTKKKEKRKVDLEVGQVSFEIPLIGPANDRAGYGLKIAGFEELINKIPLLPELFNYTESKRCGYLTLKGGLMRFICELVYQFGRLPNDEELFDYLFAHDVDLELHTGHYFRPTKFITYCIDKGATVEYVGKEYVEFKENNRFEIPKQSEFTFAELESGYYSVWFPYQAKFIKFDVHINNYTTAFMESDFYINDISVMTHKGKFEISHGFTTKEKIITQLKGKIMKINNGFFRTKQSHIKVIYRAIQFYKRGYQFDKEWLTREIDECTQIIKQAKKPYTLYFSNSKTPTQGPQIPGIIKSCTLEKIVLTEEHFKI